MKFQHLNEDCGLLLLFLVIVAINAPPKILNFWMMFFPSPGDSPKIEATQTLSSINKLQQAFFLEHKEFATQFEDLGIPVKSSTQYYEYKILPAKKDAPFAVATAIAKGTDLRNYAGVVFLTQERQQRISILCEANQFVSQQPSKQVVSPNIQNFLSSDGRVNCPAGWSQL